MEVMATLPQVVEDSSMDTDQNQKLHLQPLPPPQGPAHPRGVVSPSSLLYTLVFLVMEYGSLTEVT